MLIVILANLLDVGDMGVIPNIFRLGEHQLSLHLILTDEVESCVHIEDTQLLPLWAP